MLPSSTEVKTPPTEVSGLPPRTLTVLPLSAAQQNLRSEGSSISYPAVTETTLVTGWYPLKSTVRIHQSIKNLCKLPKALVIFTTEVYALELLQYRKNYLNATQIIVRPFESFAMTCPSMMSLWDGQWLLDPSRNKNTPESYALAAMKQEFMRIVTNHNRFQSKWFVWCDPGLFSYSALLGYSMSFPSEIERLCLAGRMTFLEVSMIPESYILDREEGKPLEYPIAVQHLGGDCIVGDAAAWQEFGEAYKEMLKEFVLRGWFAGKDTDVYFAMLMEKTVPPYRLFHATAFGQEREVVEGIEWFSLAPMLAGTIDAPLDTRFE